MQHQCALVLRTFTGLDWPKDFGPNDALAWENLVGTGPSVQGAFSGELETARPWHSHAASVLGCSAPTAASVPCHFRVNARQTVPHSPDLFHSRCMGHHAVDPFLTVNCTHPSSCFSFFNDSSLIRWIQFTTHRSHWSQSGWCSNTGAPNSLLWCVHRFFFC
jgi:hypothetical protein